MEVHCSGRGRLQREENGKGETLKMRSIKGAHPRPAESATCSGNEPVPSLCPALFKLKAKGAHSAEASIRHSG